jgi:hypothetical protein
MVTFEFEDHGSREKNMRILHRTPEGQFPDESVGLPSIE